MNKKVPLYDQFSEDYDRFVDWEARLAVELPFLKRQIDAVSAVPDQPSLQILDAACGTGQHVIALTRAGYACAGADASAEMINQARQHARDADLPIPFEVAGFGELEPAFGQQSQDVILCLGNSLPHILTPAELAASLADFRAVLRPGGRLIIQNRNFDQVLAQHQRWMAPQTHHGGGRTTLFVRFYDFDPDGLITFNILTLRGDAGEAYRQEQVSTRLWPMTEEVLTSALTAAEFSEISRYGDLTGSPFDRDQSGNLVIIAR